MFNAIVCYFFIFIEKLLNLKIRVFEKEFKHLMKSCKRILVVDSLGFAPCKIFKTKKFYI